jgi:hypothetical protein
MVSADCRLLQQTDVWYSLTSYLTLLVLLLTLLCASFSWIIGIFLGLSKRKGGCGRLEWSGINKSCYNLTTVVKSWWKTKPKTNERQLPEKVSESSPKTTNVRVVFIPNLVTSKNLPITNAPGGLSHMQQIQPEFFKVCPLVELRCLAIPTRHGIASSLTIYVNANRWVRNANSFVHTPNGEQPLYNWHDKPRAALQMKACIAK